MYAIGRCPGNLILIVGGKDKGMDLSLLKKCLIQERIRGICLIGQMKDLLKDILTDAPFVETCDSLSEAMGACARLARSGDTVLFSPGFASFDMFRDFEDRGRMFKQEVNKLFNNS
jgi:UDP-N-acetylmuramoylalanine--D-glutamate ligase